MQIEIEWLRMAEIPSDQRKSVIEIPRKKGPAAQVDACSNRSNSISIWRRLSENFLYILSAH